MRIKSIMKHHQLILKPLQGTIEPGQGHGYYKSSMSARGGPEGHGRGAPTTPRHAGKKLSSLVGHAGRCGLDNGGGA